MSTIKHYPLGETAIVLCFGDVISPDINSFISAFASHLDDLKEHRIIEYVPAFTTITIYYDPTVTSYTSMVKLLFNLVENLNIQTKQGVLEKKIPVYYNGPDLEYVSEYTGLNKQDIIRLHSQPTYLVYMIGFVPGFPYLGGMNQLLAAPRKEIPRMKVEAGSVGIAGEQTGIYPMETPGGWQIIGKTPIVLFDINREEPSYLQAGDLIRFVPVEQEEFISIYETENGN